MKKDLKTLCWNQSGGQRQVVFLREESVQHPWCSSGGGGGDTHLHKKGRFKGSEKGKVSD